jgi:hypothetical protein
MVGANGLMVYWIRIARVDRCICCWICRLNVAVILEVANGL